MSSSRVNMEKFLIPLKEILQATEDFSNDNIIGRGGFGAVYKGQLSERWQNNIIAIKRLDPKLGQGTNEFLNELGLLSSIQHPNIIRLIGYCHEDNEMVMVYEYASKGGLAHYLENPDEMRRITWRQRLNICLGTAEGLKHLHAGLGNRRIIHRDVKSANILLDHNMDAKITDFGLSRSVTRNQLGTEFLTTVAGTQGYVDPEYYERGILSKESDVYSFGVVMFEMLCGMPVYYERRIADDKPRKLINLVQRYSDLDMIIDPSMRGQIDMRSANTFKKIAYKCIRHNFRERPTMDMIIKKIHKALKFEDRRLHMLQPSSKHRPTRSNDIHHKQPSSVSNLRSTWYNDIPHKPPRSVSDLRPSWAK